MTTRTAAFFAALFLALTAWFFGSLVVMFPPDDPTTQAQAALKAWLWVVCGASFICAAFFGLYAFLRSAERRKTGASVVG